MKSKYSKVEIIKYFENCMTEHENADYEDAVLIGVDAQNIAFTDKIDYA